MNLHQDFIELASEYGFIGDDQFFAHSGIIFAICSDFFAWGCVDCEPVKTEDIALIEQACKDCDEASEFSSCEWGLRLWIARKRQRRPQGAYYKHIPEKLWPLFNDCGEHREAELGNPIETPNA